MPTSSSSPPSPPPTSASAVLAALLSSVAAYILGAIVLPYLSAFFKRDRALKKLDLPTPKARNFAERVFGTMARFDPTSPANYCRTVMQAWARECGEPPLMVSRGMQRHLVIVLDPAAANAVLSRASGQEKSTEAYFGLNLISDPRGRNTILSHATASREWKWVRKAVAPAFSQAAMKAGFEGAIRPSAEAAAEALARACDEKSKSSPSEKEGAAAAAASVSVNVDDLAAATAMDVITAFGFGVRSNAVERLGAELAERERTRKEESSGGIGGDAKSSSSPSSGSSPIPVPEPLIPGAEHTVEAMHAATEAAELYVVEPWRAWRLFRLSEPVRRGAVAMARVRACIDAVLAAAAAAAEKKANEEERRGGGGGNDGEGGEGGGGVSGGGGKSEETIFSRLRAVAPEVAALDPTDDPAACLRREAGLLYFAGIDTSSHTLAYTLALLAAHPRAAAKVEAELASAGLLASSSSSSSAASSDSDSSSTLPPPRRLEFADLSRSALPYLNAVLLESMRLMPVAAGGTARTAGRGGFELTVPEWEEQKKGGGESGGGGGAGRRLGGTTTTRTVRVPEGVDMWVPFYVLHRSKKVWGEDADEFVPERFLDPAAPFVGGGGGSEKEGGARKKGGEGGGDDDDEAAAAGEAARRFLPFSLGARDCVGQALARTALVAELATLLGRFSFEVDRERMGGSLLPSSPPEVEEGGGSGGEKVKDADGIEGLGSTVIANEAMAVTLRVLGGVWLLARPRAARGAAAVVGGERES